MASSNWIQPSISGPKRMPKPSMSTTSATGRRSRPTINGVAAAMAAMTSSEDNSDFRSLSDAVAMTATRSIRASLQRWSLVL